MNYEIVKDESVLLDFINWLPKLEESEIYYLCLFARNKYCKGTTHIKSDKQQLKRFTSTKERMFEKIKQLECEYGAYKQKDTIIPQEALALYITVNPRNLWKATFNSLVTLSKCIQNNNRQINPHQQVMSDIQRAKSRTCYIDVDIDNKCTLISLQHYLKGIINMDAVCILETRGGYHVLIDPEKVEVWYKKTWYKNLSKLEGIDQIGDQMIPVPGCSQGNFIPKFVNLK